ncbi:hypothetical protein [Rhodococcus marinonascens]|uniref:hypothetical protein n=1 Tax=Rhodococcus marinonascens TaxID=38311 RepID=UPI0014743FD9|nr:hypothetical protein [Rhodococcus marinonascens]
MRRVRAEIGYLFGGDAVGMLVGGALRIGQPFPFQSMRARLEDTWLARLEDTWLARLEE